MSSINETNMQKTNVTPLEIASNGVSLPEESEILEAVIQDFKNAFGDKLKFKNASGEFLLSTPQGQLATSIAAIISDRNRLLAYYVNQVDPNYAVGRMQDGIGRIYFIERKRATYTTVVGRCYGKEDTDILAGTKVQDQQGNVFISLIDAKIKAQTLTDKNGADVIENGQLKIESYVDITFQSMEKGKITCPAETLTERYQVIQGWESVINLNDGIVGIEDESQAQFEQRRRQSVAHNSLNSVDSIMAALLTLDEVEDAYVVENYQETYSYHLEDESIVFPFELKTHSVYACVSMKLPGNEVVYLDPATNKPDPDKQSDIVKLIAQTIWHKKTPGCALNGFVAVNVKDDTKDINGNLLYNSETAPIYLINFDFAQRTPICIEVIMSKPEPIIGDPVTLVQNKIYDVFTGQSGSRKPRIGSQILASQFYCAVQSLGDWVRVVSIKIGFLSDEKEFLAELAKPDDPKNPKDIKELTKLIHPTKNVIRVAINKIPTLDTNHINVTFVDEAQEVSNG